MRLTLRQLLTRGRVLILVALAALPPAIALLYTFSNSPTDPQTILTTRLYNGLVYTLVVPIVALVFAAAALGSELEDGTIVYLLLKPVARWRILVSKLVVTVLVIAAFAAVCIVLTALIIDRGIGELEAARAFAAGAVLGAAAYGAIFCYLSLITSRTLIAGLLYVFIWEGLLTRLFRGTRNLSVREYMRGLADAMSTLPNTVFNASLSGQRALISAAIVVVVFALLAVHRLRTLNVQ